MEAQRLSLDRISTLPPTIIEDILCRLYSIQEAVRTSILSKKWRYKWTKIPKLVFGEVWFNQPTVGFWSEESNEEEANEMKKMNLKFKVFHAIYQVLIMHQGPIHEFTLVMELDRTCIDLDNIVSYLSRKHAVKKLKLHLTDDDEQGLYYCVPLSIFSLHQLTNLYLHCCDLNHQPTFNGFGNLTTLYLEEVYITSKSLLHLLSKCPLLKNCTLILNDEQIICEDNCTIIELFQCLPAIESLTTWTWILYCFRYDQESITKELPISLFNLKYFSLAHKNGLEIVDFDNLTPELEFVKFILATSPELKKVHLCFDGEDELDEDEESDLVRSLLHPPPASPAVKIIVTADYFDFWKK